MKGIKDDNEGKFFTNKSGVYGYYKNENSVIDDWDSIFKGNPDKTPQDLKRQDKAFNKKFLKDIRAGELLDEENKETGIREKIFNRLYKLVNFFVSLKGHGESSKE